MKANNNSSSNIHNNPPEVTIILNIPSSMVNRKFPVRLLDPVVTTNTITDLVALNMLDSFLLAMALEDQGDHQDTLLGVDNQDIT